MRQLISNDNELRAFVPNVLATVDDETDFFSKLAPFLEVQQIWLETYVTGVDTLPLSDANMVLLRKALVHRALADAIPSLDLVLTPTGFGVVNTSENAPASKERVERLIASIRSTADDALDLLLASLRGLSEWRSSEPGLSYCGTLLRSLSDVRRWHRSGNIMETFDKAVSLAHQFEAEAASLYLGSGLIHTLVGYVDGTRTGDALDVECASLLPIVRNAENQWMDAHFHNQKLKCPDSHELWHLLAPVLSRIKLLNRIFKEIWYPEKGCELDSFKNDIPGAFYF